MNKAITQHYWGVQPITPAGKSRRVTHQEGQARQLEAYIEARKRERRLQVVPRTEITEAEEIQAIVESIDVIGKPIMWAAGIGILIVLLVQNYGLWIIPGLVSIWGLKKLWPRLWGCKNERN